MKWFSFSVIFLVLAISGYAENVSAVSVLFDSSGTKYVYLPVEYLQIRDFRFNITGSNYSGSFPQNITIDVLNDTLIDWGFRPYHSETPLIDSTVLSAWTQAATSARIYIKSDMTAGSSGTTLGSIKNNQFFRNDISLTGKIGLSANEYIISNIVAITTNLTTVHAFLPSASPIGKAGFYVAEGGSTYYCNSNHSFYYSTGCDLTPAQAINSAHLARVANATTGFSWMEPVVSQSITDRINQFLPGCGSPCNIVIRITTGSAGNITLEDFKVTGPEGPAKIEVENNTNSYKITILKNQTLTEIKYGFMAKPNVYIVPIVAKDDNATLSSIAQTRLQILADNIALKWDRLTNHSHPMNFTVYMTPMQLVNFSMTDDFSEYRLESEDIFLESVKSPGILLIADVKDYFSDMSPYNERTTLDDRGLISIIYLNGFTDEKSLSGLDNYSEIILPNLLLHELAHTFVIYPGKANYFYGGHPASFTNLAGFSSFSISESFDGEEGYYEPNSILNQLCPYIVDREPTLSPLDRMYLGTLNEYVKKNYTYYKGNTVLLGNKYVQTGLTATTSTDAAPLYLYSTDYLWWDVRNATSYTDTDMEIITLPKSGQDGRALIVYANDAGHSDNFQVFNFEAASSTNLMNVTPYVVLLSPENGYNSTTANVTVTCRAYNQFDLLTLYANTTGEGMMVQIYNTTQSELTYEFTNLTDGSYDWRCLARVSGFSTGSDRIFSVRLPIALYCGDGSCNNGESCSSCPQDCGSCPTAPTSGGGGGGGGGGKGVPPRTQISQYWDILKAGENSMSIGSLDYGARKITFTTNMEAYRVTLKVSRIVNISKNISLPLGLIYKVFEINQVNFPSTEKIFIQFGVRKEWLRNNSVNANDIVLKRYVPPQWVDLGTSVINQSDKYFYYETTTLGFSYFAIGVRGPESLDVTGTNIINKTEEKNITIVPGAQNITAVNVSPTFNESGLNELRKEGNMKLYLVILGTVAVVGLLIFIFLRRRDQS